MFVAVQFAGAAQNPTRIRALEKFSRLGPAEKWMQKHPRLSVTESDGSTYVYRSVVFALPRTFVLRNDFVQDACHRLGPATSWTVGKYHVYRLAAYDIIGLKKDWPEFQQPLDGETAVTDPRIANGVVDPDQPKDQDVLVQDSSLPAPTAGDPAPSGQ